MDETRTYLFSSDDAIQIAAKYLKEDQIIAAPTDTVYGLLARFDRPAAIRKLYICKERPLDKAIPVLLGHVNQLGLVAKLATEATSSDELARAKLTQTLMERWWPGPLTLILPSRTELPQILTAGQESIAVRIPDHKRLRELIQLAGPLAGTSANLSGAPETTDAEATLAQLSGRVSAVFDGGICTGGTASTIVDLTVAPHEKPRILRAGPLAAEIEDMLLGYG